MRLAQVVQNRRSLKDRAAAWPLKIERIAFDAVPNIGTGEISLSSPLTVLSGPNGIGKTTLLRAIWAALVPDLATAESATCQRLRSGSCAVDVVINGVASTCEGRFNAAGCEGDANHGIALIHIDTAAEVARMQELFVHLPDGDQYVEGIGSYDLTAKEIEEVSFLARREYRAVKLFENDLFGDPFPYFEVSQGDSRYDSRTMGSGELAAFYIWWSLRNAEHQSIILIEEPESYLSPGSQDAVASLLAAKVLSGRHVCIATSHSAPIIGSCNKESLRFLSKVGGNTISVDNPLPIQLKSLGIEQNVQAVVFVEDRAGERLGRFILEKYDAPLARRVDFSIRNGHGEVTSAIRAVDNTQRMKFVGWYDGDMRGDAALAAVRERAAFLPGELRVERIFRNLVSENPNPLATAINFDRLEEVLSGLEGSEDHDWYADLCRELGRSQEQLFPILLQQWMSIEENEQAARAAYEALSALISDPTE